MDEMTPRDTKNLLEEMITKLAKPGGPLDGLANNRERIMDATMDALKEDGVKLTKESLKDKAMLFLITSTLVKAAITEKFNPTGPQNIKSLDQRFNELTPEQQKACKKEIQSLVNKIEPKFKAQSQSPEITEKLAMVVITDSAGTVLGTENRYAQSKMAFDTISAILQRDPVEDVFSPFLQDLLANTGHLAHESSISMKPKFGPPGAKT